MTSLSMNLVKRIERLPKPSSASGAMQPLFEAVSNAIQSTQERFKSRVAAQGSIFVDVNTNRDKDGVYTWAKTADGRGRIYQPNNGFRGTIELIGWDALLNDAGARNRAFFERVGISEKNYFSE